METINRHHQEADTQHKLHILEWEWAIAELEPHIIKIQVPEHFTPRIKVWEDYENFDKWTH